MPMKKLAMLSVCFTVLQKARGVTPTDEVKGQRRLRCDLFDVITLFFTSMSLIALRELRTTYWVPNTLKHMIGPGVE